MKIFFDMDEHMNHFYHFVHAMEYYYFIADFMVTLGKQTTYYAKKLHDLQNKPIDEKNRYCIDFLKGILKQGYHLSFVNSESDCTYDKKFVFSHNELYKSNYFIDNENRLSDYKPWFLNKKSKDIRNMFIPINENNNTLTIGLINRVINRKLVNHSDIENEIYKQFKIKVSSTYFEDKDFDYQINFMNQHNIILSPHGAQLCSIPFLQDNSLVIEFVHDEWHPYSYFGGLSNTSDIYHAVIGNHKDFPNWKNSEYCNRGQKKLNIIGDVSKCMNIIQQYIENGCKLKTKNCYVV